MAHHGMNKLDGMDAFCHYGHAQKDGDRFGRIFSLSPLYTPPESLRALGAQGGPMDGGASFARTDSVPAGQLFFGQFIDHDITLDVTSSLSSVADASDTPNVRTPVLDLDNIYGAGPEASPYLYHGSGDDAGVKLLSGADGTAADQPDDLATHDLCRSPDGTAIIGDPRNDENGVISQLQLAMIRFHNAVVDTIHDEDGLEGEELFEEARTVTTWHYQSVIVQDFLPTLCGQAVVDQIRSRGRRFYCPSTETPYIPIEFAVAAYRFGHSMMPQRVQVQKNGNAFELFGATLGRGFSPLSDEDAVVDWHELLDTDENRNVQNAEELDTQLATDLLDLPFIHEGESSLATRNLLRGQTFLLPSGEQVARAMEREPAEIDRVTEAARERAEPDVDLTGGTPLWFYILTEAERIGRETEPGHFEPGEGLGPVGARIVTETLYGLIELDDASFLGRNRNWDPVADGVGVQTLGEMLTYSA
ncbi:MAG: heme peroxidase family protein [Salinibacter sp.]